VGTGLAFIDVDIVSLGQRAEIGGGIVLIGIGSVILAEHRGYLS
jgi:putative Mn2+ efflux pump MntP